LNEILRYRGLGYVGADIADFQCVACLQSSDNKLFHFYIPF